MFSKACEYGIKAIIHIMRQSQNEEKTSLKIIAKAIDSPEAFTAKILQSLAREQIIESHKGPTGGYFIPNDAQSKITLFHIVKAIDGEKIYNGCGLGLKQCDANKPCPIHYQFKTIRDELKDMLQSTYIEQLANGLETGVAFLKN
jgi:Rrf2 family protein